MLEVQITNSLMNQKEAAAYLGTTVKSLNTWRARGKYNIPYVRWGKNIRYKKESLDAWIMEHTTNGQTHGPTLS